MKLEITPKAQEWFKEEISLAPGMGIRFYGKVYGKTDVHEGFSIGISAEQPVQPLLKEEVDGITYYIEETDDWFFKGYDLTVDFDEKLEEPKYVFTKNQEDEKQ